VALHRRTVPEGEQQAPPLDQDAIGAEAQVIVGLGNPEPRYAGTPHNVGYEVVDRLAAALGLTWETTPEAWIARGSSRQPGVCLIKVRTAMNRIGATLKPLAERLAFVPEQCILVHDDLDLPLGSVRIRLSGGAGGHRGVASILEAFQSDAFRRVKIGVGQPGAKLDRVAYVLTAFDAASRAAVDPAIAAAEARALELAERPVAATLTDAATYRAFHHQHTVRACAGHALARAQGAGRSARRPHHRDDRRVLAPHAHETRLHRRHRQRRQDHDNRIVLGCFTTGEREPANSTGP
jgi:PTH1 family peptidyl-tRNA hydrolase